jgi:phage protein D
MEVERSDVGHRAVVQDNQYDLAFLHERASWIGYEVVYDSEADKLYFRKSTAVSRRTLSLNWGRSLISFKPKLTTKDQVKQVKVRWWDPKADKAREVTVSRESLEMPGLKGSKLSSSVGRSLSNATEVVIDQPVHSEAEARRVAREKLQQIVKEMQTCEGQTVGLPELRAGTLVEIGEVGDTFGGLYFVTSTTHAIGNGYTVEFEARREVR